MAIFSLCGNVGANTGPILCDISRGVPKVLILGGAEFTPSEYATSEAFKEALLERINLANGDTEKMYPFPEIQNVVNNTEANTTGTTGLGLQLILREGRPAYTFGVLVGTNLEKQLRKFNRQIVPVMVFDDGGNTWGGLTAVKNFKGSNALIYVSAKPYSDGSSVDTLYTNVSVSFTSLDMVDNAAFANTDFNVNELEGLLDATLIENTPNTTNVYHIKPVYQNAQLGGDLPLADKYGADLAVVGLWKAYTGATLSTPLTITSVALNAAAKDYTVTFDSTAYTALAALAKIKLQLDTPANLKAADVVGIESVPLILTKD